MLKQRILPLLDIIGIDTKFIKKLTDLGIDSAEELVALVATPGGQELLAKYLGLDEDAFKAFIETAKKSLPADIRKEMSKPSQLPVMFGARMPQRRQDFEAEAAKHPDEPPKKATSEFSNAVDQFKSITIPADVNLIPKMPPIKNQGKRGTCVAFASLAVLEYLKGTNQDFSEQYLYWWCDKHDRVADVPGTTVKNAYTGLVDEGVCKEETWEYNSKLIEGNEGQGPPPEEAKKEAGKFKLEGKLDLDENSVSELKNCLEGKDGFSGRPITFTVPVYNSWLRSKAVELSGQITMPLPGEASQGGHGMVIVGYQEDASVPGGGFFIIRNSWGTAWGKKCKYGAGHGTIPFKYISEYCWEAYTGSGKPSGWPCFIATAAYGSPYAPEVQFLRSFRDCQLRSSEGGRAFVNFYERIYYSFSPYIAEKMNKNRSMKNVIRWVVVSPIVFILKKAIGLIERNK